MKILQLFLSIAILATHSAHSARILAVYHMAAFSHYKLGDKILKELVARGHEVTVITPYVEKTPIKNFKQIILTGMIEDFEKIKANLFEQPGFGAAARIMWVNALGLDTSEKVLKHENVQKLIKSNEQFDLVIVEQFLDESFRGFCHRFNAPCVMSSTVGPTLWTNPSVANPGPPSYVPSFHLSMTPYMDFWQRLHNSFIYLFETLYFHFETFPKQNELLQKYFPDAPHLYNLYYNTSLILLNSHVSTNPAVPLVPNMIEIGGFHIDPPKNLPEDLQNYLDSAEDGVIFFSMGSNLKSKDLPSEKRNAILRVFSKLKQKVLWKWENETLPNQPPNVKLAKWLPQQDILAHPNVKLFITHGGLLSTLETIYHGVPVVGIPVFGDQEMNVANAEIGGYGLSVPYKSLSEESLSIALNEVLNNPKYSENAKRRSKIMHDQPQKPLEKAMFWIEYVIRHRGAPHLRSAALNLSWYQYLLLDVIAITVLTVLIMIVVFCKILKSVCCRKDYKKVSQAKKGN